MINLSKLDNWQKLSYFLLLICCLQFFIAATDSVIKYSPVPIGDSWDSMIGFINDYKIKGISSLFSLHNEHRIVLTKIFFGINAILFNGENWPLIMLNYVLAGLSFAIFYSLIKQSFNNEQILNKKDQNIKNYAKNYIFSLTFILLFSKMQAENFDWEFQSQFFLAYLLPLFALYLLGKSAQSSKNSVILFISSCFFGILSAGTMANGVFALPAMVFLALLLRTGWQKIVILTILSITVLALYLNDYHAPSSHSSFESLLHPLKMFLYMASYFGLIFKFLIGKIGCRIFGVLFLVLLAINLWKIYKQQEKSWINITLISFISFVALTGLISAIGRAEAFGVSQAYSGRYATPVTMAWVSFLIIYSNSIIDFIKKSEKNKYIILILPLSLLIYQADKIDIEKSNMAIFEKNISVLALELNIKDKRQISKNKIGSLHHTMQKILPNSQIASKNNFSIFNHPLIRDVNEKIGTKISPDSEKKLIKYEITIENIPGEEKFNRISGSLKIPSPQYKENKSFYLINNNIISGYVILNNDKTKFKGYISKNLSDKKIYFYNEQ